MSVQAMARDVRAESTGWRDQEISQRHRAYGFNCPAADLDFLLVEFNFGKPVALVEYKHHKVVFPDLKHPTYRAITALADAAKLPFLVAFYWPKQWAYRVWPANVEGHKHFKAGELLTERRFVARLYRMRDLAIAESLAGQLNDDLPPEG
jgi:hypothetical protein